MPRDIEQELRNAQETITQYKTIANSFMSSHNEQSLQMKSMVAFVKKIIGMYNERTNTICNQALLIKWQTIALLGVTTGAIISLIALFMK